MGANLITLAEYKAYKELVTTKQDALITTLLPKVSAFIKTYCRRTFVDYASTPKLEEFNGGTVKFILDEEPVIQVLNVQRSADHGQTWTDMARYTDYYLEVNTKYPVTLSTEAIFPREFRYLVTYTGGYTEVPEDLKLAALDLIAYYIKNDAAVHSNKAPGTNSVQIEYMSDAKLPANIKRVLDQYVNHYL